MGRTLTERPMGQERSTSVAGVALWARLTRDERDGPLAGLLVLLTVASGMIDAVSILRLGHVFAAAMTGNLLFIGFAVAGAPGFTVANSGTALGAFVVGAYVGGGLVSSRRVSRRGGVFVRAQALPISVPVAGP